MTEFVPDQTTLGNQSTGHEGGILEGEGKAADYNSAIAASADAVSSTAQSEHGDNSGKDEKAGTNDNTLQRVTATNFSAKWRQQHACERCRRLKVRCAYDDPSYDACRRCFSAGVQCSLVYEDRTPSDSKITKPSLSRKRGMTRKRVGRSADQLEQCIYDMFSIVSDMVSTDPAVDSNSESVETGSSRAETPSRSQKDSEEHTSTAQTRQKLNDLSPEKLTQIQSQLGELQVLLDQYTKGHLQNQDSHSTEVASTINSIKDGPVRLVSRLPAIPYERNVVKELIRLNLITEKTAKKMYTVFLKDMICYWPCVPIPSSWSFEYLIEEQPLVLLAFLCVTALNSPELHDTLVYYLERNLAQRVNITGDLTVDLVQIYIVLSLWGTPPKKWGSYKHQMHLLMALDLCLCLDLSNERYMISGNYLQTDSEDRKAIRAFMEVYCCCGSLGLSLPRFKLVTWGQSHEAACMALSRGEVEPGDVFLVQFSRLVALGQEIYDVLCPETGFANKNQKQNLSTERLKTITANYEKQLQKLASDSDILKPESKPRHLYEIIYYQLLMSMYDYSVYRSLCSQPIDDNFCQLLGRLISAAEKVIDAYVNLCDQTHRYPTFFYYRPMHALVALIRARLIVRSQSLEIEINVEREFDRVNTAMSNEMRKSLVAQKMYPILKRVEKWMRASSNFSSDGENVSLVRLLDELGKERGVENIDIPTKPKSTDQSKSPMGSDVQAELQFNRDQNDLALNSADVADIPVKGAPPITAHQNLLPQTTPAPQVSHFANNVTHPSQMINQMTHTLPRYPAPNMHPGGPIPHNMPLYVQNPVNVTASAPPTQQFPGPHLMPVLHHAESSFNRPQLMYSTMPVEAVLTPLTNNTGMMPQLEDVTGVNNGFLQPGMSKQGSSGLEHLPPEPTIKPNYETGSERLSDGNLERSLREIFSEIDADVFQCMSDQGLEDDGSNQQVELGAQAMTEPEFTLQYPSGPETLDPQSFLFGPAHIAPNGVDPYSNFFW